MNAARYARFRAKRDAGICVFRVSCQAPATHGILCGKHRKIQAAHVRKSVGKLRLSRKLAGLCVRCGGNPKETSTLCEACTASTSKLREAWRANGGRAVSTAYEKKRRKRRAAKGLCTRCNRKRVTKTLCQVHREAALQRFSKVKKAGVGKIVRCGNCDEIGHNRRNCRVPARLALLDRPLPPLPPLRIEDFASARTEVVA